MMTRQLRVPRTRTFLSAIVVILAGMITFGPSRSDAAGVEVTYMTDTVSAARCGSGGTPDVTPDLHYRVFEPTTPGPHPIVFGMQGTAFQGSADCAGGNIEKYRWLDGIMQTWADAGYVAVNVEYHGAQNGVIGTSTYPGVGQNWGTIADATTELNLKVAVKHFFDNNPGQYEADEDEGLIAFGTSSGGYGAYMLANTGGSDGHTFDAAIAWSGFPEPDAYSGTEIVDYLCPGSLQSGGACIDTRLEFGSPIDRITSSAPPTYIAGSKDEFGPYLGLEHYGTTCKSLISICWIRVMDGDNHANKIRNVAFSAADYDVRPKKTGTTVFDDTIEFANRQLP